VDRARFASSEAGGQATPPPPDPAIEARKAREEGLAAGYQEGLLRGLNEGRELGTGEGYRDGFAQGESEAKTSHEAELARVQEAHSTEMTALEDRFREGMTKFIDDAYEALRHWQAETIEAHALFGLEVARRAVAHELHLSRQSALALAKEALGELHQGTEFRILVNPTDVSFLEGHRQELLESFAHVRGLEVIPDRTIDGGVIIESHSGTIDARVEAYLQRMAESALKGREAA
jgi:flagellar biosynthesis/type III secretory pathway protein FliH